MPSDTDKVEVENINTPGRVQRLERVKYIAMRNALLSVLPSKSPGATVAEAKANLLPLLPQDISPIIGDRPRFNGTVDGSCKKNRGLSPITLSPIIRYYLPVPYYC